MSDAMPTFRDFFQALWECDPFPWQTMLADQVMNGEWPRCINLPTASGKTACIDVAVYTLATQADLPVSQRTMPRRIWFVVDRRIVVDEAYERARNIVKKLCNAESQLLEIVANRLRKLSGLADNSRPLALARLRGGILKDDGWARIPSQPAVVTSTVDQLGSNLLFQSYAYGQKTAPIFAGLAANDSIVFLDEAHCSRPFAQTLEAVQNFRGEKWAEKPIQNPFTFVMMSATPGKRENSNEDDKRIFPRNDSERNSALNHEELQKRIQAKKQTELYEVKNGKTKKDTLIQKVIELTEQKLNENKSPLKIALIVNRVNTAEKLTLGLKEKMNDKADVVLLTGRFRPYERDVLVAYWKKYLKASDAEVPQRPILFVSTQCIEVGADFSFDVMITECASLDALRQRFGRVNRLGEGNSSHVNAVLIRSKDIEKKSGDDPLYGKAMKNTWKCFESSEVEESSKVKRDKKEEKKPSVIDFGIEAMDKFIQEIDELDSCLAPALDAPVLLPAHLDSLCQTSPNPHPTPDISLFLHGKCRGAPEARVVWRADLNEKNRDAWPEIVAACPPIRLETLSVPLFRLRQWLKMPETEDNLGDIEGLASEDTGGKNKTKNRKEVDENPSTKRPQNRYFLRWRGRKEEKSSQSTLVLKEPEKIAPEDLIVIPADYEIKGLGHTFLDKKKRKGVGKDRLDIYEAAQEAAGRAPALRLTRSIEDESMEHPQIKQFLKWIDSKEPSDKEIQERIDELKLWQPVEEEEIPLPEHIKTFVDNHSKLRIEPHPGGGCILFGKSPQRNVEEDDLFADEDDLTSTAQNSIKLKDHLNDVACLAEKLAKHCLPSEFSSLFRIAGQWHDEGKRDERFQCLLRNGDEVVAIGESPLAKSDKIPGSPKKRRDIRENIGLPQSFRHEMLSFQLVERFAELPLNKDERELIVHLIASHHGYARPLAPVCVDNNPPKVIFINEDEAFNFEAEDRCKLIPPHRLDSGVPERFWSLTCRYGWWGLAYLESILRLADWRASRNLQSNSETIKQNE